MKFILPSIALVLAFAGSILANTFTVTNTANSGAGSLAQAITDANNHVGLDTINFNIPGPGVHTISPLTPLPAITDSVLIDGYSQPGASVNTLTNGDNAVLLIELNGANLGASINAVGLVLAGGASTVRGLVINRCSAFGVFIQTSGHLIAGNFIGTDPTGTMAFPNTQTQGVEVRSLNFSSPTNNTIGGTTPDARNLLSGNSAGGIDIGGGAATGNVVQGNFIGTDATGKKALPNDIGISVLGSSSNVIGGTVAGSRNVISGNKSFGIDLNSGSDHSVQGNFIGVDVTGTGALGNGRFGIAAESFNTMIGGTIAGSGNTIAFNGATSGDGCGIEVVTATGVAILGNSIFGNTSNGIPAGRGLGIDLNLDGVTLNDPGDADSGANNLQNFPVITSVSSSGGMTTITGTLNSVANTMYRIEFFANDAIDPTGYGEGQIYLGFVNTNTNGSGDATFNTAVAQIGANQRVTATATDSNGNTSEFSGAIGQLLNISTRMEVQTGGSVLIGGFIVGGTGNKEALLRALGPTLQNFGINDFLADPTLDLYDGSGHLIMSNDNWKDTQQAQIMATGKQPPNDLEPAILHSFAPGNYTAIVRGKNNTTGVGLVEAYDIDNSNAITLTNISTRGFVDTGQNVMIGGFISGNGIVRVIVRALGPTLAQFGVPNVLADPTLDVRDAQGTSLATNDNWADTQQAEIQASGHAPPDAKESAVIIVRPAGNTTAIVSGKNGTTGNALVEVYILPP